MKNRIRVLLSLGWGATWKALTFLWPEKVARPIVRILFLLYGAATILWVFTMPNFPAPRHYIESPTNEPTAATTLNNISSSLAIDYKLNKNYIEYLYRIAEKYSNVYNLDPLLVMSIMATESSFQTSATSNKGCVGLMQINWPVWDKELRKKGIAKNNINIYDVNINIEAGCFIYSSLLDKNMRSNDKALNQYLGANSVSYKQNIYSTYGRLKLIASQGKG